MIPKSVSSRWGSGLPPNNGSQSPVSPHRKRHFHRSSRFSTAHARDQETDGQAHRQTHKQTVRIGFGECNFLFRALQFVTNLATKFRCLTIHVLRVVKRSEYFIV